MTATQLLEPHAQLELGTLELAPREGSVQLDAMGIPYGTAQLTTPLIDVAELELLDPRDDLRGQLTAGDQIAGTSRVFDLGLRSRRVDHARKLIEWQLATDEALLMEYRALVDDEGAWEHRGSLRAIVNYVLGKIGASLAASPAPDADMTPRWQLENLISNARGLVNANGWGSSTSTGAGTVSTVATAFAADGAALSTALRLTMTTASTANALLRYGDATGPRVTPGQLYTFRTFVYQNAGVEKNGRVILRFVNESGATLAERVVGRPLTSEAFAPISATMLAPAGAARAVVYAGVSNGMPVGATVRTTGATLVAGARVDEWFDGDRPDDTAYDYWANDTTSIRSPKLETPTPEALIWGAGVSGWSFLEPLLAAAGLRLFCDERRVWRLIEPARYTMPGLYTLTADTATLGTDEITRDDPELSCTGVAVRYRWTDEQGIERTRLDTAGAPGRVLLVELERPYPGAGVAAAILARRTGRGRVQEVTAYARWSVSPAAHARIVLPGTLAQQGQIEAVEWGLTDGLMTVRTAALIDLIPGSIDALEGTIGALTGTIDSL